MNEWIDAESRVDLAQRLYDEGRWVEAAAELRAAIDLNPYNSSWHFNLALTLEALEQFDHATQCFKSALDLEPNDVETLNALGVNMTRQGRHAESLEYFERIEKIKPGFEASYCNRIVTYCDIGQHDKAELMFYMARQVSDECPLCYYNIGNSLYAREMYDKAIHCWKQTLRLDPAHPQANARIGDAFWAKGELATATDFYKAELVLDPKDIETLLDLGELQMELGRLDDAGEKFRRVLEIEPDNAEGHYAMGELSLRRGQLARAEEQFRLVLRIDRNYPGANARLARLLLMQDRGRQSVRHVLAELKRCNGDVDMLHELGQLLIDANQTNTANSVLRQLVELSPDDPYAQHNLAVSYFMMDRLDDGIRHCRRALKIKPEYTLALYNLALAHMIKGQVLRAKRYAAKAMTASPSDPLVTQLTHRLNEMGLWAGIRRRLHIKR